MTTLADYLDYWARFRPGEEAIVCGADRLTWAEYHRRASRVAAGLQTLGVRSGDRVAILLESGAAWATAFAAIVLAGGVIVPLNPRYGRFELRETEDDAECAAVIGARSAAEHLGDRFHFGAGAAEEIVLAPRLPAKAQALSFQDAIAAELPFDPPLRDPAAVAAIFYTSGTTGRPRGAMHTHASMQACALAHILGMKLDSDDRTLIMAPLAFTGSSLVRFTPMLFVGGCSVITAAFEAAKTLQVLLSERITVTSGVPPIWEQLSQTPGFAAADLTRLKLIQTGGAPVPPHLLRLMHRKGAPMRQVYGSTEAGGIVCYPTPDMALSKPTSAGFPQVSVKLRVVAADGSDCGPGQFGEVWISGPQVMKGYWRNPQATAEALKDGWYRSGDLGFFDEDGALSIVDRIKNMVISGGVNIYPAEVERALASISVIREVGVFGAAHERWGESLVAVVHADDGADLDSIKAEARALLGAIKVPRAIVLSPAPLPKTVGSKIARAELPAVYVALTGDTALKAKAPAAPAAG